MTDLGTLSGGNSCAYGINNSGQVVGESNSSNGSRAFLWQDNTMVDINSFLPENSGWVLENATDINDSGQIVGYGYYNGQTRAFLLSPDLPPVPEPATIVLLLAGLLGLAVRSRK